MKLISCFIVKGTLNFVLLHSLKLKRLRSLVNRASDSGSEGRGFESHRGHEVNPCKLNTYEDFFVIEFVIVVLKISKKRLKLFCC